MSYVRAQEVLIKDTGPGLSMKQCSTSKSSWLKKKAIFFIAKVFFAASLCFSWAVYVGNCSAEVKK